MLDIDEEYGYLKVESLEDLEERYRALTEERSSCEKFLQKNSIHDETKSDIYNDLIFDPGLGREQGLMQRQCFLDVQIVPGIPCPYCRENYNWT